MSSQASFNSKKSTSKPKEDLKRKSTKKKKSFSKKKTSKGSLSRGNSKPKGNSQKTLKSRKTGSQLKGSKKGSLQSATSEKKSKKATSKKSLQKNSSKEEENEDGEKKKKSSKTLSEVTTYSTMPNSSLNETTKNLDNQTTDELSQMNKSSSASQKSREEYGPLNCQSPAVETEVDSRKHWKVSGHRHYHRRKYWGRGQRRPRDCRGGDWLREWARFRDRRRLRSSDTRRERIQSAGGLDRGLSGRRKRQSSNPVGVHCRNQRRNGQFGTYPIDKEIQYKADWEIKYQDNAVVHSESIQKIK